MIDREAIRKLEELSPAGANLVADLIAVFADETPIVLADMKRALATGDLTQLKRKAHMLKSSCANLGATTMQQDSEKIELATIAGDRDLLGSLVEALESGFQSSLQELRRIN